MADEGPQGHYFSEQPAAPSRRSTVNVNLPDLSIELTTDTGVFGRGGVDPGTKLLLSSGPAPTPGDRHLLDLGCGYGPIAIALALRNPTATVWAVDVNQRARELCDLNVRRAGIDNVEVIAPDRFDPDLPLDRIWSNPPIRIGKQALHRLLTTWLDRLAVNGSAHLVVQRHLGSDSLQRWLNRQGWTTTRRRSQAAYRLLDVAARRPPGAVGPDVESTADRENHLR